MGDLEFLVDSIAIVESSNHIHMAILGGYAPTFLQNIGPAKTGPTGTLVPALDYSYSTAY